MTEEHRGILEKIRSNGALKHCTECGGTDFEYVGRSTGAAMIYTPDDLKPDELLLNTRSYKMHVVSCLGCDRVSGFMDRD